MSFKAFVTMWVVIVLVSLGVAIAMAVLTGLSEKSAVVLEPVKPIEYVIIGNGIHRTDDLEKGVSCYSKNSGQFSCVKVSQ